MSDVTNVSFLHSSECSNSPEDIVRMQRMLALDPGALERKSDVLYISESTPLFHAACKGHLNCLKFLINSGADTSLLIHGEYDLMTRAVSSGKLEIVSYLLEHGFSPNYEVGMFELLGKNYYLCCAISSQKTAHDCIKLLIEYGAQVNDLRDINVEAYFSNCPSIHSIVMKNPSALKLLLLHGAAIDHTKFKNMDVNPEMIDCLSLLHCASISFDGSQIDDEIPVLNILYQFGANMWQKHSKHGLNTLQIRENRELWLEERRILAGFEGEINEEKFKLVSERLKELMSHPVSLQSLARISIMRAMGPEYLHNLPKLPKLPRQIKAFLRMCDV